ncbi:hypothetical protein EVAR_21950_1 [Eumeta japonica]|uniref:Histone-lysine N-methyltransferase SETMAR n=1 Tax=Eumeta variegata TaxID=151549 RepID=A0A4C1VXY4_EUMVA|nr:hypothetical protein EVAR_21950_1 [Eumeta japonica]
MNYQPQECMKKIMGKKETSSTDYIETQISSQYVDTVYGEIGRALFIMRLYCRAKLLIRISTANRLMKLQQEVEKKRRESINKKGVILHQHNARPHTSLATQQILKNLVFSPVPVSSEFFRRRGLTDLLRVHLVRFAISMRRVTLDSNSQALVTRHLRYDTLGFTEKE